VSDAPTTMQWIRTAAQRISRGSGRLTILIARRITVRGAARLRAWGSGISGWLGQASGGEWLLRLCCLIVLGLVARRVLQGVSDGLLGTVDAVATRLMWPASIVWVIVAYRIGREDWRPRSERKEPDSEPAATEVDDEDDDGGDEQFVHAVEDQPAGPPLPTREQLAESLARVGTPHAHIAALADDLSTTPEQVRAALDQYGVPVEPVRMRGRGSSTGIKGGSLPTPARPHGGVVAAGQPANNNDNNSGAVVITDDPDNPYRHYVHYAKD
jgi:hypothetical protein